MAANGSSTPSVCHWPKLGNELTYRRIVVISGISIIVSSTTLQRPLRVPADPVRPPLPDHLPTPAAPTTGFDGWFFLRLAFVFALLGCFSFAIDHAASVGFATPPHVVWPLKGDLRKLVALSEVFGHGTGVLLVILAVFAIDLPNRWKTGILLTTAFGGGLMANVVKICSVARYRPHAFDFSNSIWDSFQQWAPILSWTVNEELQKASLQSFPSAHAATAAGLCVGLCYFYPHARWFFVMLMSLAGLQRVVFGMHFPSDVLFGAAVGLVTATLLLTHSGLPSLVEKIERRIRSTHPTSGVA